jgi:hypothetical protein
MKEEETMAVVKHKIPVAMRALHIAGLLLAAAGIMTLFITNSVDSPVIWVGPIVLATLAALILVRPRRWTVGLGIGFSLFVLVGAFIAPGLFDRLSDPTAAGAFFGTAIQIAGLVTALAAGAMAFARTQPVPGGDRRVRRPAS